VTTKAESAMARDYIEPTGVALTVNSDTAFTRRFGKKVRTAGGDYTDVRSGESHRRVRIPIGARDLADEILRAFPRVTYRNGTLVPMPFDLAFRWDRRVEGVLAQVLVASDRPAPIVDGLSEIEKRWKTAQAKGALTVGESQEEERTRLVAEQRAEDEHRQALAALVTRAGGELHQDDRGWFSEGRDVAVMERYVVRFNVTHAGVRCARVLLKAAEGEPVGPQQLADLLERLGGDS
jgi:hypothetical protein